MSKKPGESLSTAPKLPPYDPAQAEAWMREALALAEQARQIDEVPVGCVIYDAGGQRLAGAYDLRQAEANPLAHAEWLALHEAGRTQGDWRLDATTLVVTLEPCPMCAGAILMSRVGRIIYGASSPKWGAAGSCSDWLGAGSFPHKPEVISGLLAEECGALLSEYFRDLRVKQGQR